MLTTLPLSNVQRILLGSVNPVARGVLFDQDGTPTNGVGTVTASVYSLAGVLSGAPGRSTIALGSGAYTVALTTAEASTLNVWRVDWFDGATLRGSTFHRIVGGFMFALGDLRAMSGVGDDYSTPELLRVREWITNLIEFQTGAAWSPRLDVDVFESRGISRHVTTYRPLRALRSITVDGEAENIADAELDRDAGIISDIWFYDQCEVVYEHGYESPPETLREAALIGAADKLKRGGTSLTARVRTVATDMGVESLSYPGMGHPTGIDFVDAAIMKYDQRMPGWA
jgi:hypothetical protein